MLAPILHKDTETLILGSYPSKIAIEKKQHYGNPANDFWRLLGAAIGEDLSGSYKERLDILKKHRIGLWNVYQYAERKGSMDKDIKNPVLIDFSRLKKYRIKRIFFNGMEAGKHAHILEKMGYSASILPSSSPANRRKERLKAWLAIRQSA
jgi:hypoxanthine-DNA glycosylase